MTTSIAVQDAWAIVLFGATGDAAQRMYAPGLFSAHTQELIHPSTAIIGVAPEFWKQVWDQSKFKAHIREGIKQFGGGISSEEEWEKFSRNLYLLPGDVCQTALYRELKWFLASLTERHSTDGRTLFIFSLPPHLLKKVITQLGNNGFLNDRDKTRVFIDKPYAESFEGAIALTMAIKKI